MGVRVDPSLKLEEDFDPAFGGHIPVLLGICRIRIREAFEDANHFLHTLYSSVRGWRVRFLSMNSRKTDSVAASEGG